MIIDTDEREIKIKDLSLAAFIRMKNNILIDVRDGFFIFHSKLTEREWKIEFLKSESSKFDREVRDLRWCIKNN